MAVVKLLSPFRYPGGKTWFVPFIRRWLSTLQYTPSEFLEPFAGGAIVGLNVAYYSLAKHVTIVEMDDDVSAVWHTLFNDAEGAQWLAQRITGFYLNHYMVQLELSLSPESVRQRAFQTILKNRVNRGGIIAPGAGLLKKGENGRGLVSRWYPKTLKSRLLCLSELRDRISFIHGDGIEIIRQHAHCKRLAAFIDPPYTLSASRVGSRLYKLHNLDHGRLFDAVSEFDGDFLMTYDDDEAVRQLAARHGFQVETIRMRNAHHTFKTELIIGRDLSWFDQQI